MADKDLTTLATVKQYLRIDAAETDFDALLESLISAASSFIQGILGREFKAADYTQTENGTGAGHMVAFAFPVISVTSVKIDGRDIPPAANQVSAGFIADEFAFHLRGFRFTKGVQNVEIKYRAGYETIPESIDNCCCELVAKKYKYRDRIGHLSKILQGETITYEKSDLTEEMKSILRNFAKVVPN